MNLNSIKNLLSAEILCGDNMLEKEVKYIFSSDLMSDVLSLVNKDVVLMTGLTNVQTIRTAEMMDIKCIIFVRGKTPSPQVIQLAKDMGMCLMLTKYIMFTSCGILYKAGMKGTDS